MPTDTLPDGPPPHPALRVLDGLYLWAGRLAALSVLAICLLVSSQVGLNILARVGGPGYAFTIPSYADFTGFLLAGATFLAMAHTMRSGSHIRVTLVIRVLPRGARRLLEIPVVVLAATMTGYATWYTGLLVEESIVYGDMSPGIIAVPLWIPQLPMVAGLALLTVALIHTLVEVILSDGPVLSEEGGE